MFVFHRYGKFANHRHHSTLVSLIRLSLRSPSVPPPFPFKVYLCLLIPAELAVKHAVPLTVYLFKLKFEFVLPSFYLGSLCKNSVAPSSY